MHKLNDSQMQLPMCTRIRLLILCMTTTCLPYSLSAQEQPWLNDPVVMAVIALRQQETAAMLAGTAGIEAENYSSTFVANTPDRGVIARKEMVEFLKSGTVSYAAIEQTIEYAGAHGDDMVVIMGLEIVVPGPGMTNAGQRVHRRFTDIFRNENGVWRHDLRHANVVKVE